MAQDVRGADSELVGAAVRASPFAIVITDPRLEDNPITYVNAAFERLTLYGRDFAVGRNCRFLQGPQTHPREVAQIRAGLASGEEFEVVVTNHRADGSAFRNQLLIAPIHAEDGALTGFFGVLRRVVDRAGADVSGPEDDTLALLRELQHRVKNHLAMIVSMIRIQASRDITPDSFRAVSRRVEALALLYEELFQVSAAGDDGRAIAGGAYLGRVAATLSNLEQRPGVAVDVSCAEVDLAADQAARLGVLLSELLTNALEHAFAGRDSGRVAVEFVRRPEGGLRLTVEDDGVGMPEGSDWPARAPSIARQQDRAEQSEGTLDTTGGGGASGVGGSIVSALVRSLDATIAVERRTPGTSVTVEVPAGGVGDGA